MISTLVEVVGAALIIAGIALLSFPLGLTSHLVRPLPLSG